MKKVEEHSLLTMDTIEYYRNKGLSDFKIVHEFVEMFEGMYYVHTALPLDKYPCKKLAEILCLDESVVGAIVHSDFDGTVLRILSPM